ncbi:MarC family protein [Brenneria goodwinii]|uniref:MarC family protein n=1 Tax=Brenneria goodwinii TaxID=1109412 RepID=UPI0009E219B3|nr:MarC family protein [Brenneria goodwinii]
MVQSLLSFSDYIKFFIGLFALINPIGILPVFISMTNYLAVEGRKFRAAPLLVRVLGQTGMNVITRIMGLLLMSLGIEFIVTGVKALFPGLL